MKEIKKKIKSYFDKIPKWILIIFWGFIFSLWLIYSIGAVLLFLNDFLTYDINVSRFIGHILIFILMYYVAKKMLLLWRYVGKK